MIFWRGLGCLSIVIFIGVGAFSAFILAQIGIDPALYEVELLIPAAVLGGLINWFVGRDLNSGKYEDVSGIGYPHELFFIRMEYWTLIWIFLAISIPVSMKIVDYAVHYENQVEAQTLFHVKGKINGIAYTLNFSSNRKNVQIIDMQPRPDGINLPQLLEERKELNLTYITKEDENIETVYVKILAEEDFFAFILLDKGREIEIKEIKND